MNFLLRIIILPLGLIKKIFDLSLDGSRDILNTFRFKNVKIDKGSSVDKNSTIENHVHILANTTINCGVYTMFLKAVAGAAKLISLAPP